MELANEYRRYAEEAMRNAERARDSISRHQWLIVAQEWARLFKARREQLAREESERVPAVENS